MKATPEQQVCIDTAKKFQYTRINAYAGAGKSSTLRMIADELAVPSLYVCFNKAVAEEAKEKFPSYVDCKTSHSLAYAAVGNKYTHKLKRPQGKYVNVCGTGSEIASYFKIDEIELTQDIVITTGAIGTAIKETLTRFEQSADDKLSKQHVSFNVVSRFVDKQFFDKGHWRALILKHAEKLWKLRINTNTTILCTHDTYLKLWQLSKPDLSKYEVIYLDEAQDSNPCLLDILYAQKNKLILVGDRFQEIYSWRGSVNAMMQDGGMDWNECLLSTSFRYGQNVARVANSILQLNEDEKVKGFGADSISRDEEDCIHTRIYRTNTALITEAISFITAGKKCSLEIDTSDFVKLLESAMSLKQGNTKGVKHDDLVAYSSWNELEQEAPANLSPVINMVNKNMHYTALGVLKEHDNPSNPDVTFITAHKSKGREWDVVVLADDFKSPMVKGEFVGLPDEERNLMYVASTRAKKLLIYNQPVQDYLDNDI